MKLIYDVNDRPKLGQVVMFSIQQMLAIMAATLAVPKMVGNGMSPAAALFGAGVGTLVYLLFTRGKSPVFLGSSFAFIDSLEVAFAGATSMAVGYFGLLLGAVFAGLVYVVIAIIVKFVGVRWINKVMPAVVIGPTVAIIGLTLAESAIENLKSTPTSSDSKIAIVCGLVTLAVTMICSSSRNKTLRLIPFIIGILAGYATAAAFTLIGIATGIDVLLVSDFSPLVNLFANGVSVSSFLTVPDFTFLTAFGGFGELSASYIGTIAVAYIPVAFVVFAEHIADHKNISTIIEHNLLTDPGLSRTLLGDGIGSIVGAFFGGCPNTTYGESIACVAITRNASIVSIFGAAVGAIVIAFIAPFVAFVDSIPSCVMGGVCMALYGFIAVSGLKMVQTVDLDDNKNLFVVSVILIAGIGCLSVTFGKITLTEVACALILGVLTNVLLSGKNDAITKAQKGNQSDKK